MKSPPQIIVNNYLKFYMEHAYPSISFDGSYLGVGLLDLTIVALKFIFRLYVLHCVLALCVKRFKNSLIGLTNPVIAVAKTERKLR